MKKMLNLLILFGILCQGVLGTWAEANIKKPSDVLVRHKRVFHSNSSRDISSSIENSPYVVNIKTNNGNHETTFCVGVILAPSTIITAAKCARLSVQFYSVYSGSRYSVGGKRHIVTSKKLHFSSNFRKNPYRQGDGIALMFVRSNFEFSPTTKAISIHRAPVPPHSIGKISGWGYCCTTSQVPEPEMTLRSIKVSTMLNRNCESYYNSAMEIHANDVCTYDAEKHCGHTDLGAPLVIDDKLVGIHLFSGTLNGESRPDIFALLQYPEYFNWIIANFITRTE